MFIALRQSAHGSDQGELVLGFIDLDEVILGDASPQYVMASALSHFGSVTDQRSLD
jgi:hypothetical protein